jgi:hypothetical protein
MPLVLESATVIDKRSLPQPGKFRGPSIVNLSFQLWNLQPQSYWKAVVVYYGWRTLRFINTRARLKC